MFSTVAYILSCNFALQRDLFCCWLWSGSSSNVTESVLLSVQTIIYVFHRFFIDFTFYSAAQTAFLSELYSLLLQQYPWIILNRLSLYGPSSFHPGSYTDTAKSLIVFLWRNRSTGQCSKRMQMLKEAVSLIYGIFLKNWKISYIFPDIFFLYYIFIYFFLFFCYFYYYCCHYCPPLR